MTAVVVTGPKAWELQPTEARHPGSGEVRLELVSAGICGGDLALVAGENAVARYPLTLGHECVARVREVGAGAGLQVGQAVIVYPTLSCGVCDACTSEAENQCDQMRVMGLSDPAGCFTDSLTVSAAQCIPLPEVVATAYGCLLEPFAVACHVLRRAGRIHDQEVVIVGSGVIGLMTAVAARLSGARAVHCVDRHPGRGTVADQLGATTFTVAGGVELVDHLRSAAQDIDVVVDTVCTDATASVALEVLRRGGRYLPVASAKPGQALHLRYDRLFLHELQVITARNYSRVDFHAAIEMLLQHRPELGPMITATHPLGQFGAALDQLRTDPGSHLKVQLVASGGQVA